MNHVSSPLSGTDLPFNSLFEMPTSSTAPGTGWRASFNSLFEMLGALEIGFREFLSFDGGVWVFVEALLAVVILVFVFVSVRRVWWCVYLRVFSPRRL
jgi:hypothetical protein